MKRSLRVLYVEEPSRIRDETAATLLRRAFQVELADSANTATRRLRASAFDVVVLDGQLPRDIALRWLAARRKVAESVPLVLLCDLGNDAQVLAGYRAGARLCLTRPIRGDVLAAHLRALLAPLEPRAFRLGRLSFDPARKRLTFPGGTTVSLPPLELQLLLSLARSLGSPVPHKRLMDDVWPSGDQPSVMNGLYVVAGRLRKLFGPYGWMVRAVRRSGYMLTVERRRPKEEVPIDRRVRGRHRT